MKKTLIAALLLSAWLAPAASQLPRDLRTDGKAVQSAFAEAAKAARVGRGCQRSPCSATGGEACRIYSGKETGLGLTGLD